MALVSLYRQLFPETTTAAVACPCHCHVPHPDGFQCRCIKNCAHCRPQRPPKAPGAERRYVRLLGHGLAELQRHHAPHAPAWEGYQAVRDALADLAPHLSPEEDGHE